jgi:hypothetical protein
MIIFCRKSCLGAEGYEGDERDNGKKAKKKKISQLGSSNLAYQPKSYRNLILQYSTKFVEKYFLQKINFRDI